MFKLKHFFLASLLVLLLVHFVKAQKPLKTDNKELKNKFVISVVMPFCSKQIMADPNSKNAALGNACRQYFEGFKLALDSFNNSETPLEIRVFDSMGDSNVFKSIIAKKEFQESNLIFGPVVKDGHTMMKAYCEQFKVYNISPFLTLTKTKIDNPYLISSYPDLSYYADFILEQIKLGGWNDANVVVFMGKDANEKIIGSRMLALKNKYSGFSIKTIDISKYVEYRNSYKLDYSNHIIIDSDNEFLVNTALRYLADTNQFRDLFVYGSKKWFDFKTVNLPIWQQLNVNIINPCFIDFNDQKVKNFIENYRERYYAEPSEFAFNGYEQATYFIGYFLANNGKMEKISEMPKLKPLTNWFKIDPKAEGNGFQNTRLNMLYFEENELKRWE